MSLSENKNIIDLRMELKECLEQNELFRTQIKMQETDNELLLKIFNEFKFLISFNSENAMANNSECENCENIHKRLNALRKDIINVKKTQSSTILSKNGNFDELVVICWENRYENESVEYKVEMIRQLIDEKLNHIRSKSQIDDKRMTNDRHIFNLITYEIFNNSLQIDGLNTERFSMKHNYYKIMPIPRVLSEIILSKPLTQTLATFEDTNNAMFVVNTKLSANVSKPLQNKSNTSSLISTKQFNSLFEERSQSGHIYCRQTAIDNVREVRVDENANNNDLEDQSSSSSSSLEETAMAILEKRRNLSQNPMYYSNDDENTSEQRTYDYDLDDIQLLNEIDNIIENKYDRNLIKKLVNKTANEQIFEIQDYLFE